MVFAESLTEITFANNTLVTVNDEPFVFDKSSHHFNTSHYNLRIEANYVDVNCACDQIKYFGMLGADNHHIQVQDQNSSTFLDFQTLLRDSFQCKSGLGKIKWLVYDDLKCQNEHEHGYFAKGTLSFPKILANIRLE